MTLIKYSDIVRDVRGLALPNYRVKVLTSAGAEVDIYADSSSTRFTDGTGATVNYTTANDTGRAEFYWIPATGQSLQVLDTTNMQVDIDVDFADKFVISNLPGEIPQSAVTDLTTDLADKANATDVTALEGRILTLPQYNAVGDGATDDYTEIATADTAAGEQQIFGEGRTYFVGTGQNLPAGFKLQDGHILHEDWDQVGTPVDDYGVTTLGYQALSSNTYIPEQHPASSGRNFASGNCIVAIGYRAMFSNTTGRRMTALGYRSMHNNTTGYYNTALGSHTLESNSTGYQNLAAGVQALQANTTGYNNTGLGNGCGVALTTGYENTFVGSESGRGITNGVDNVSVGYQSLGAVSGAGMSQNVGIGAYAGRLLTGNDNVLIGYRAGYDLAFASDNTAVGKDAIVSATTGSQLTALGARAAQNITTQSGVTSVGCDSLAGATVGNITAVGYEAGKAVTTSTEVTYIGYRAGLAGTSGVTNSTGVGSQVLLAATGPNNTAVGRQAGVGVTTGGSNTFIGEQAGASETTGDNNTAVGKSANSAGTGYSNTTCLGYNTQPTMSNQVVIGDANVVETKTQGVFKASSGTATAAGGSTSTGIRLGSDGPGIYFGSGAPTVSAVKGSIYLRTDGSTTNDRFYINTDGSTTWTAGTTAA